MEEIRYEIVCDWKGKFKEYKSPITERYEFTGTPEQLQKHIKNIKDEGYLNIFFHRI